MKSVSIQTAKPKQEVLCGTWRVSKCVTIFFNQYGVQKIIEEVARS